MSFFGMGPLELVLILALALIIFGPDKLPEIAQQVGRAIREVRKLGSEVTEEIQRGIEPDKPPATTYHAPGDSVSRPSIRSPGAADIATSVSQTASEPTAAAAPRSKDRDIEPPY